MDYLDDIQLCSKETFETLIDQRKIFKARFAKCVLKQSLKIFIVPGRNSQQQFN